jgi:DUF4097 and DUF4098 domain-containing protein YvlB
LRVDIMKRRASLFTVVAVMALATAWPVQARPRTRAERGREQTAAQTSQGDRVSRTIHLGKAGQFDLSNVSGEIRVTGGAGEDVRIEAVKHPADRADRVRIDISETAGRVEVRTLYPDRHGNVSVNYTVTVPRGTTVSLKSVSGSVNVTTVDGEVRVESISGDVQASSARVTMAKSVSGDVILRAVSGDPEMTLRSVSGDVKVTGLKAHGIDVSTVSGTVILADVACERASVSSVSGPVDYTGPLAKGGHYEMKSHSGAVHVGIQGPTGFELTARTFSGTIHSEVPVTLGAGEGERRAAMRKDVHGTYGDGGAVLVLTSFSGGITIAKR